MAINDYLSRIAETVLANVSVITTGAKVQYVWNPAFEAVFSDLLNELRDEGWNAALTQQKEGTK